MICEHCKREMVLYWHTNNEKWELLSQKWHKKILCIECFISLASKRQNKLQVLSGSDFGRITIASKE